MTAWWFSLILAAELAVIVGAVRSIQLAVRRSYRNAQYRQRVAERSHRPGPIDPVVWRSEAAHAEALAILRDRPIPVRLLTLARKAVR